MLLPFRSGSPATTVYRALSLFTCQQKLTMGSTICSVRGCYNNWMKRRQFLGQECFEHRPLLRSQCCGPPYNLHAPPRDAEKFKLWVKALNLKKTPKRPYVCSFHFVDGKPTEEHPFPEKYMGSGETVRKKKPKRERVRTPKVVMKPAKSKHINVEVKEPKLKEPQVQREVTTMSEHSYCQMPQKPSTCDKGTQCCKEPLYKDFLRTDSLCLLHTGLPLSTFHLLARNLLPLYKGSFQLDPTDQLLMTLMKLKLNLLQEYLAEKFSVCQISVSRILAYWIDLMESHTKSYIPWLPRETIVKTMPQCFKEHYPGTTCIIDCLETHLQKPRTLDSSGEPYRHFYEQNTIKFMVAIAPCGLIMFISPAYGGSSSDEFITSDSGFLDCLHPGDEVMADHGFRIRDVLDKRRVKFTIPACTKRGSELSEEDAAHIRGTANVRLHMERVICRLKYFKILSETVPASLNPKMDKILIICAALCNLRGDIINEEE